MVQSARHFKRVLSFLVDFNDEVVVLQDELLHDLGIIETKVSDRILLRSGTELCVAASRQRSETQPSCATLRANPSMVTSCTRGRLRQTMSPSCQCYGRGGLTATLAEVPLVDWQGNIQPEKELVLGKEGWYASYNSLIETSGCHERVQSQVKLLLACSVQLFAFQGFRRVCRP